TPWPGLEYSYNFTHFRGKPCPVRNCLISYNKSRVKDSDAVLFHARDLPSAFELAKIPRTSRQRWAFLVHENPFFSYKNLSEYNHLFNWTMTYRTDSDFFVPYNYYRRLTPEELSTIEEPKNYAAKKDKLVAWMVGHCGKPRDHVVQQLSMYLNVTVFGACAKHFNQTGNHCRRGSRRCSSLLRRFKFYLAFENAMCVDYVTEKYWYTPFDHDMVPVVLGSNYGPEVAIPGSFINVLDFKSVRALAEYLNYLDANDSAYNAYFLWKTKYKVEYSLPVVWTCNICAALNNNSVPTSIYHDLGSYWGVNTCGKNQDKLDNLLQGVVQSGTF
ncbi:Alpha-(1,3)-fucosyltransferase C, partial [Exaiptasia diaphana]